MKVRRFLKHTFLTAALLVLFVSPVGQAQTAKPGPEHQKMHVWLGDWEWVEESRDSPTDSWQTATWVGQARLMDGGFFVEARWKGTVNGQEVTAVEIEGYDPIKKVNVRTFFESTGTMGTVTSVVYKGNTEEARYTAIDPGGKKIEVRCTWQFSEDSMSLTGSCDQLTDGEWWLFRRAVKATKTRQ